MTDKPSDRKAESLTALKNANKHLSDLFTELSKKDGVLYKVASDLQYVAKQCGEIQVRVYRGSSPETVTLKSYLEELSNALGAAR